MIKKYKLNNYKCLNMEEDLNLKNLTIISGNNNAGKSAFIKSIMDFMNTNGHIIMNNACIGDFKEKVINKNINEKISYSVKYQLTKSASVELDIEFSYDEKENDGFINKYELKIEFGNKIEAYIILTKDTYSDKEYSIESYQMLEVVFGKSITNDVPIQVNVVGEVFFTGYHPVRINFDLKKNQILQKHFKTENNEPLRCSVAFMYKISNIGNDLKYLGPLRSKPEEYYTINPTINTISPNGDNFVGVLKKYIHKTVSFYKSLNKDEEKTQLCLEEAVKYWFKFFFGENEELEINSIKSNLIEILINGHSIKHSGFGFSQILPVIVQSLLISEKSILLLEQPEIHLHPDLEMKLAYFLLCMAKDNKQIIVETHSEHIINQIILENTRSKNDLYSIYFFEKEKIDDITKIKSIELSDNGTIKNWPNGFFDQYFKFSKELAKIRVEQIHI